MPRVATTVWAISPALVLALDERLGPPTDSYVNGSQTWLVDASDTCDASDARDASGASGADALTLELRLHPVAGYRTPRGMSHYDVWETVIAQLSQPVDPHALRLGDETRALTGVWDGLECFAAYGEEVEPPRLAAAATAALGVAPDRVGLVDHDEIGDAWERAQGRVSIVALLLEHLAR